MVVGGLGWESSGGVDYGRRRDVGFEEERRWKAEGLGVVVVSEDLAGGWLEVVEGWSVGERGLMEGERRGDE